MSKRSFLSKGYEVSHENFSDVVPHRVCHFTALSRPLLLKHQSSTPTPPHPIPYICSMNGSLIPVLVYTQAASFFILFLFNLIYRIHDKQTKTRELCLALGLSPRNNLAWKRIIVL